MIRVVFSDLEPTAKALSLQGEGWVRVSRAMSPGARLRLAPPHPSLCRRVTVPRTVTKTATHPLGERELWPNENGLEAIRPDCANDVWAACARRSMLIEGRAKSRPKGARERHRRDAREWRVSEHKGG